MAATSDIIATYRGPATVMARMMARGPREDRALIYLMVACILVFVAQTPRLAREAFDTQTDLGMLLGAALMAWFFIAPLVFYILAGITYGVARVLRSKITAYGARLALFWALLASAPIILLWGLTAGFIGPGTEMTLVGILWFAAFMWFWIAGFRAAAAHAAAVGKPAS